MNTIDRRSLHFAEAVKAKFGFLTANGFKRVKSEPTFVRFESGGIYVNVYHGRMSFELGLEIGQMESLDEEPYSMSEIIRFTEPDKSDRYRDYATRDVSGVEEGVQRLAALFRRYVDAGLFDDGQLFTRLRKQREIYIGKFALEVNLTQARRKLDSAWQAKDYAKVVELLNPWRDALTPTELHKLEYAAKHARES